MTRSPLTTESTPISSPWLTTEEAAIYMRLGSGSSVRSLMARGELVPDARTGRRGSFLFLTATLDRYLMSQVLPRDRRPEVPARGASGRRKGTSRFAPDDPKDGRTIRERLRAAVEAGQAKARRHAGVPDDGGDEPHQPRR
jgi:hypothetical protein